MIFTEYAYSTGAVIFVVTTLVVLFILFKMIDMDGGL